MSDSLSSHRRKLLVPDIPASDIPAAEDYTNDRRSSYQYRVIDAIARFASSPICLYFHIAWFAFWIGMCVWSSLTWDEPPSFELLALVVSLEAVFLSTFVLISQHRGDAIRQHVANEHWAMVEKLYEQNCQLMGAIRLTGVLPESGEGTSESGRPTPATRRTPGAQRLKGDGTVPE
jgi:hypothetical protein